LVLESGDAIENVPVPDAFGLNVILLILKAPAAK
jgi:hypothetical protein